MPKSEVLIEMPEFEKKYNLAMVDTEKVTSRVRPKQFLHIDEAECILCEGCVDICPWKCIHYLSVDAIDDSINVEAPDESEAPGFFVVDEEACTRCALCVDRCGAVVFYLISLFIVRAELNVFSDIFLVNSLYTGTHIYVGVAFIYMAIVHFLMTRPLQAVLFNKTLSSITFWGFLFLLPWTNFKYYYGSVLPNWIENISIYLSMSLVVPLLAFLVNYIKTIQSKEVDGVGSLNLLNFSVILFSITTIFHMISSFENLLPILGITNFVNVITYGLVGSLVLATISLSYYLIPKLYGREVNYSRLEDITFFGFKISYLLLLINNTLLGVNSGYSWNAGANAGSPTIYGEGYGIVWSLISFNFSVNTFVSLLLLGSGFLYLISVIRAISSGSITTVEEMVYSND